jgi:hypothetical protein
MNSDASSRPLATVRHGSQLCTSEMENPENPMPPFIATAICNAASYA